MEAPVINESTFSSANPSSYSLSEIWPITTTSTTLPFDSHLDHSTLTHHHRTPYHNNKRKHSSSTTTPNHLNDCSGNKHMKSGGSSEENGASSEAKVAASSVAGNKLTQQGAKLNNKPSEAPKQDYIHVRARRGQATDSHSLAERARREKISERMKILQDLVPGCNKVIGKALVLDEIINYIQSLQRQVEFLSMKLEAVNSRFNTSPTVECFTSKDVGTQPFDLAGMIFGSQATRGFIEGSQPGWLHMQLGGGFERAT